MGFRATAARIASGLGLTGWVRNLEDGGVRVEATGETSDLGIFLQRLRDSPAGRGIEREDLAWIPPQEGSGESFRVHGY